MKYYRCNTGHRGLAAGAIYRINENGVAYWHHTALLWQPSFASYTSDFNNPDMFTPMCEEEVFLEIL